MLGPDHPRWIADPLDQGEPSLAHLGDPLFGLPQPKFRRRHAGAGRLQKLALQRPHAVDLRQGERRPLSRPAVPFRDHSRTHLLGLGRQFRNGNGDHRRFPNEPVGGRLEVGPKLFALGVVGLGVAVLLTTLRGDILALQRARRRPQMHAGFAVRPLLG